MTGPVALALSAMVCGNVFLVLSLLGASTAPDQSTGTKLWASFGILTVLLALNAYALDGLGHHFGF